ncbi:MAG: glycosyltransferase family 39 protein [candidate division KSB1 bacterium]|nr:glycosyltransferase family 39 protein [candidate division KSB1 bacterium]
MKNLLQRFVLTAVLLPALILRIWKIEDRLPYVYHPDEPRWVQISQNIFKTGDLNPHFFNYPSMLFYVNAAAYVPYYWIGKAIGTFKNPQDILPAQNQVMGSYFVPYPSTMIMARLISVLFSLATVGLVYYLGKRLDGPAVGLLAALLLAVEPTHIDNSRIVGPDVLMTFFCVAALAFSLRILERGRLRDYLAAGSAVGLAAAAKYNALPIAALIPVAHALHRDRPLLDRRLAYAPLAGIAMFLLIVPFAVFDFRTFIRKVLFEASHYSRAGHPGMEGKALFWYLHYMAKTGALIYLFAALQILRGIRQRHRGVILLSAFPLIYFAFISLMKVRNDRTFLPIIPFAALLAAQLILWLHHEIRQRTKSKFSFAALFLALLALLQPLRITHRDLSARLQPDSRDLAREWVYAHVPQGSKIALESYSPYIDPQRYQVQGFRALIEQPPDAFLEQGFQVLIFSRGMYGRFFREPQRYADEIARYRALFDRFPLLQSFNGGGYEVRIHRVVP